MRKEYMLITGITGFIGSHVANKLISEKQYKIIAIVRRNSKYGDIDELKQKGVKIIKGDFHNSDLIEKIFLQFPIAYVMHIAALRGGGAGTNEEYFKVNVKGTELLLEFSFKHKIQKFVFISSVGVFGTIPSELPANKKTKLLGDNEYHKTKILAEQKVRHFINKGLNAYIIRPTITYGPNDNGFPSTLIKLVKNRLFLLPFKDIQIHLLDVISLAELLCQMIKTATTNQRIFIVADKNPVSLKTLVNLIHYHFYKKEYPLVLKLPSFIFAIVSTGFKLTKNEKWLTRILLISQNWYYDIKETKKAFKFFPANTKNNLYQENGKINKIDKIFPYVILGIAGLFYWSTLAPAIIGEDSAKPCIKAQNRKLHFGSADDHHLHSVFGKLFSFLPFELAYNLNPMSAFLGRR